MARILCSHPNASTEISGIKFTKDEHGLISEEVSLERAETFADIPHFKVIASASDVKPQPVENAVSIRGPRGTLIVGGDYSPEDLNGLRSQWEFGKIIGNETFTVLRGDRGPLAVAGALDAADTAALQQHWARGRIAPPAADANLADDARDEAGGVGAGEKSGEQADGEGDDQQSAPPRRGRPPNPRP